MRAGARARTAVALALALVTAALLPDSRAQAIDAPNVVPISPQLVTAGQPTAAALRGLSAAGFQAVIYLAPPTVQDAIASEPEIVRAQGLEYVNIPIRFNNPTEADYEAFVATMNRLRGRKVLVHCQVNMRASSLTFLYRVIVGREDPERAYESVARVWSPQGPWKSLIAVQLRKAGIAFEPH